jgi:hypothetical protein
MGLEDLLRGWPFFTRCIVGHVGHGTGVDTVEKRNPFCSRRESNPASIVVKPIARANYKLNAY